MQIIKKILWRSFDSHVCPSLCFCFVSGAKYNYNEKQTNWIWIFTATLKIHLLAGTHLPVAAEQDHHKGYTVLRKPEEMKLQLPNLYCARTWVSNILESCTVLLLSVFPAITFNLYLPKWYYNDNAAATVTLMFRSHKRSWNRFDHEHSLLYTKLVNTKE